MTISDYQIGSVIKTYMKNMKVKVKNCENGEKQTPKDDGTEMPLEGMKKILYERIGKQIKGRSKRYDKK